MSLVDAKGREVASDVASLTERQQRKVMAQNATIGECNQIAYEHARNAMAHLGNQIGPFVIKAIGDAIKGYHDSLIERGIIPPDSPVGVDLAQFVSKPIDAVVPPDGPETVQ